MSKFKLILEIFKVVLTFIKSGLNIKQIKKGVDLDQKNHML